MGRESLLRSGDPSLYREHADLSWRVRAGPFQTLDVVQIQHTVERTGPVTDCDRLSIYRRNQWRDDVVGDSDDSVLESRQAGAREVRERVGENERSRSLGFD
jgi:hypothetical protein